MSITLHCYPQLWINDDLVVQNAGPCTETAMTHQGSIHMAPGFNRIRIVMATIQDKSKATAVVSVRTPCKNKHPIPNNVLFTELPAQKWFEDAGAWALM